MKIERHWVIAFIVITLITIIGLFVPTHGAVVGENFNAGDTVVGADIAWLLTSAALVLVMTPALAFFYGGMVGSKNVISTMMKSFICLGVISLLWVVVGFSMSFGTSIGGFVGNPLDFAYFSQVDVLPSKSFAPTIPFLLFALFQMKFAVITPAIITGALAERVRFVSFLLFICLFSLFIYAPLCHMVWHPQGFINTTFGILDFAGGTVVHMSAGFAALAGVLVIGKRKNSEHIPTNIPFVIIGTGLLWFGWFGFNAGSELASDGVATIAFATTIVASASAMMTWVFFDRINGRKVSALGACIGAVVGLVVITPAAGFVTVPEAIFFGFIGAIVSNIMVYWKKLKTIDDTLDVFACHGVGGIMGMILTSIFAKKGDAAVSLLHGGVEVFLEHLLALLLVSIFTFGGAWILFKITNFLIPIRVTEESEYIGLDISQHDEKF
jgi:ammonium transporter, Amt family